ncbi:7399_t:CDS:2, partial [Racocetra persica]
MHIKIAKQDLNHYKRQVARVEAHATRKRKFLKEDMEGQQRKRVKICKTTTRVTNEFEVMISTEKRNQEHGRVLMQELSPEALKVSWADSTEQEQANRNMVVTDTMEEDFDPNFSSMKVDAENLKKELSGMNDVRSGDL